MTPPRDHARPAQQAEYWDGPVTPERVDPGSSAWERWVVPSGTYHTELPSTALNDAGGVDGHALALLSEMVARFAPETPRA